MKTVTRPKPGKSSAHSADRSVKTTSARLAKSTDDNLEKKIQEKSRGEIRPALNPSERSPSQENL